MPILCKPSILGPESAGNPLRSPWWGKRDNSRSRIELAPELIRRWERWNREYIEICSRNPQLELRDMMQAISESDTASSWPAGYERHIQDWADAGDPSAPPPFDDRYGIVTPEFFSRLHALRQLCGGWLYWNDDRNCIVFAPELEWQRVRSAQEGAEAKRQSDQRESQARLQRYAIRLDEVMSIARSDKAFWEEFGRGNLAVKRSALQNCFLTDRSSGRFESSTRALRGKRS